MVNNWELRGLLNKCRVSEEEGCQTTEKYLIDRNIYLNFNTKKLKNIKNYLDKIYKKKNLKLNYLIDKKKIPSIYFY